MMMEGRKQVESTRLAYTAELDQVPRFATELIEDCSFDMDSYAVNSSRKLNDISNTFL